jgi:hypothetical protein
MRESRTFGSVGGEGGNVLAYPAISCRQLGRRTTAEDQTRHRDADYCALGRRAATGDAELTNSRGIRLGLRIFPQ